MATKTKQTKLKKQPQLMGNPIAKPLTLYYIITITLLGVAHWYIAAIDNNEITIASSLILALVALVYFAFPIIYRNQIRQQAFLRYFLHVSSYLMVNISYWLHAFVLYINRADGTEGELILSGDWMGVIIAMPLFWGFGLLLHTFGAWVSKGFEDIKI